jgi:hypothetical protein
MTADNIHWHIYGVGKGEYRASHAGSLWRIVKVGRSTFYVEVQDSESGVWQAVGTHATFRAAKASVSSVPCPAQAVKP